MAEYVIVNFVSEIHSIWDYCNIEDSASKIKKLTDEEQELSKKCRKYAEEKPDEADYWNKQADIHGKADFKCITNTEYENILRDRLLSGEPTEISKEQYDDAYDMFLLLYFTERNGYEMFCNTEMLISTYTTQYAHDMKNDKYYSKTVDIKDSDTWIDMVLLEKLHKYDYQCLSRCLSDCKYFLGNGNRDTKYLWGGQDVETHINEMKRLYTRLPIKPKWLTMEQIEEFEKAMKKE